MIVDKHALRRTNSVIKNDRFVKEKSTVYRSKSFDTAKSSKMGLLPGNHSEECFNLTFEVVRLMKKLKGFSQKKLVIDSFQNVTNNFRSENRTLMMKINERRKSCEGADSGGPVLKNHLLLGKRDYSGFVRNHALAVVEKFVKKAPEPRGDLLAQVRKGIQEYRFPKATSEFKKNSLRKLTMRVNANRLKEKSQITLDGINK
jgi:hypothetical protein